MLNFTTTYTTSTTIKRSALDNDALRRVVAVAIRRARRVRRGYKNEQRSCEKFLALLFTARCHRFNAVKSVKICDLICVKSA
jgi:hypothetical protein